MVAKLKKCKGKTLVVCEATGGLEHDLVDQPHEALIDVVIAKPAQMRNLAKGRFVRGGRPAERTALYMPTMSAMRGNPTIAQFANRHKRNGKSHKVIVTACMRKLITTLNLMIKNQTAWGETKQMR